MHTFPVRFYCPILQEKRLCRIAEHLNEQVNEYRQFNTCLVNTHLGSPGDVCGNQKAEQQTITEIVQNPG